MEFPCYSADITQRYMVVVSFWAPEKSGTTHLSVVVTEHSVKRCQQRIAPSLTCNKTRALLQAMVSKGRSRATPRRWTKGNVLPTPGLRSVYWSGLPDVCGLVVNHTLVTVVTRLIGRRQRSTGCLRSDYVQHKRRIRLTEGTTHTTESDEDDV